MKNLLLSFLFFSLCICVNAQYTLNGNSAKIDCHCYKLTNDLSTQHGSVWFNNKIDLNQSFDYSFKVFFGCTDANGADGMAFVLQPISTSVGTLGGGMGYSGVTPAVAITLDTYQNSSPDNDPTYDHIAIQLNGDLNHNTANTITPLTAISATNANVEDCIDHILRIAWDATNKSLTAWFDGQQRVTATSNFVNTVFSGNSMVYWGFTGATGMLHNVQKFCTILTPQFHFAPTQKKCVSEPITFYDSTISATGVMKRYWNFGDGSPIDSISVNPIHIYTLPGTYNVTFKVISPDGCEDIFPQTIIVGNSPNVSFSINDSCLSNPINFIDHSTILFDSLKYWYWDLDNGGVPSTSKNPITTYLTPGVKIIKLVITTKFGCRSDTIIKPINIYPSPINKFTFTDSVCLGQPTVFHDSSIVSFGTVNYWQWTYSDSSYPAKNKNPTHVFTSPGINYVTLVTSAIGNNACTSIGITKQVYVRDKPKIELYFTDTCKNFPVGFIGLEIPTNLGINSWHWNFGDGQQINGASNITHTYIHNGQYVVQLYGVAQNGCVSDVKSDTIKIFGNDVFAGSDTLVAINQPLQLQAAGGITYQWSPSYGLSATNISNPIATLSSDATYYLKAGTLGGCDSYDTVHIKVYKGPDIYMPTVFTPNNDGLNDVLTPFLVGLKNFHYFHVYDRYGQLVYSTVNSNKGWNGKMNGKDQPIGTYVWVASGTNYSGIPILKKGTVMIIR